jgi:hypothetical protein
MNRWPMNCFIELPSIANNDVKAVYTACWNALQSENIPFTCHWGQMHALTPKLLNAYFGDRVTKWRAARAALLDTTAQRVFAAPMLGDVGLG